MTDQFCPLCWLNDNIRVSSTSFPMKTLLKMKNLRNMNHDISVFLRPIHMERKRKLSSKFLVYSLILPPTKEVWGKVIFSEASATREGSASREVPAYIGSALGGRGQTPTESENQTVCILLECFLVLLVVCSFSFFLGINRPFDKLKYNYRFNLW